MNAFIRATAASVLMLWGIAAAEQRAPDRDRAQAAAFEVMNAARYATLVTVGPDGHPQARIVDPLLAPDRTIWIATNPRSRKVGEIRRDSRVTLLFFNPAASEYVTVIGRARAVTDPKTKAARWKAEWAPFYKGGAEGPDFLLYEVRPSRLVASSARLGLANDPQTWKPVIIEMNTKGDPR